MSSVRRIPIGGFRCWIVMCGSLIVACTRNRPGDEPVPPALLASTHEALPLIAGRCGFGLPDTLSPSFNRVGNAPRFVCRKTRPDGHADKRENRFFPFLSLLPRLQSESRDPLAGAYSIFGCSALCSLSGGGRSLQPSRPDKLDSQSRRNENSGSQ